MLLWLKTKALRANPRSWPGGGGSGLLISASKFFIYSIITFSPALHIPLVVLAFFIIIMEEHLGLISGKSLHVRDQLKHVAKHHVDSFNYAIDTLLPRLPDRLPEVHLVTPENAVVRPFERMSFKFLRFVLE